MSDSETNDWIREHLPNLPISTDKDTLHSYLPIYQEVFDPFRDTEGTIVEVGVEAGGSIWLWLYSFPNAQVVGVDRTLPDHPWKPKDERCVLIEGDGYSGQVLSLLRNRVIDIAIDDASHRRADQQSFLRLYGPLVRVGGLIAVEDIGSTEQAEGLCEIADEEGFDATIYDLRKKKYQEDDILVIGIKR